MDGRKGPRGNPAVRAVPHAGGLVAENPVARRIQPRRHDRPIFAPTAVRPRPDARFRNPGQPTCSTAASVQFESGSPREELAAQRRYCMPLPPPWPQ